MHACKLCACWCGCDQCDQCPVYGPVVTNGAMGPPLLSQRCPPRPPLTAASQCGTINTTFPVSRYQPCSQQPAGQADNLLPPSPLVLLRLTYLISITGYWPGWVAALPKLDKMTRDNPCPLPQDQVWVSRDESEIFSSSAFPVPSNLSLVLPSTVRHCSKSKHQQLAKRCPQPDPPLQPRPPRLALLIRAMHLYCCLLQAEVHNPAGTQKLAIWVPALNFALAKLSGTALKRRRLMT